LDAVGSALVGSAGLLALRTASAVDARIEVLINGPIGTISPEIYGYFIEHLGGVIYDGVWVLPLLRLTAAAFFRAILR